ncbi:hypothetical protein [Roseateles sp.]|uniref:hypothetical protein n=1 Tax=Roseateles sp. TaxID=1971397 RepID=UPI0025F95A49|nr:hypothetical protein [Roseateles sp.]MBV8033549.1 hypothetical protein [Roseateles sp.]
MKRRSLLAALVPVAACSRRDEQGASYLAALIAAIHDSGRIVVTEHSFELDAYDMNQGKSLLPGTVVYRTVELSPAQKATLLQSIERLDSKTQDAVPACIFEPHHTIHFHTKGRLRSTMRICFACSQMQWDETSATPPWALYRVLHDAIKALGLEPERDWRALAREHLRKLSSRPPSMST